MVHPKIIQKTAAIEDVIYTVYTLAHKTHIISGNNVLLGKPPKKEKCRD